MCVWGGGGGGSVLTILHPQSKVSPLELNISGSSTAGDSVAIHMSSILECCQWLLCKWKDPLELFVRSQGIPF